MSLAVCALLRSRFAPTAALRKQIEAHRQETHRLEGAAMIVGKRSSTTQLGEFTLGRLGLEVQAAESETAATEELAAREHCEEVLPHLRRLCGLER